MTDISRRAFMRLVAGGGITLAFQDDKSRVLVPYVHPPREAPPGVWTEYATTCRECPAGCGMVLLHRDGRATKAEGNASHPVNLGGLCPRGQASVQGLYDPDRVRAPLRGRGGERRASTWAEALEAVGGRLRSGGRVAILSGLETGAMADLLRAFSAAFGSDRLLFHEPFSHEPLKKASDALFGIPAISSFDLDGCDCVLSFAADFLESWISNVEFARRFTEARRPRNGRMAYFAYVGPRLSMTAANADDFLMVPAGMEGAAAMAVLGAMLDQGLVRGDAADIRRAVAGYDFRTPDIPGLPRARIEAVARAFAQAERPVALGGPTGAVGPAAEALATAVMLLNLAAGSVGGPVSPARPHALGAVAGEDDMRRFLASLTAEDVLIVHNANPVHARGDVAPALNRVGLVVCLTTMPDETAALADYVLPVDSPLEAWGDYEPYPDVHGLMQPTMARLHDSRHAGDVFLALAEVAGRPLAPRADSFETLLRRRWEGLRTRLAPQTPFPVFWRDALRRGGVWEERAGRAAPALRMKGPLRLPEMAKTSGFELWAWAPVMLFDGRGANRGWLQENPEPVSYIAWTSWIDLHPDAASALGVHDGEMVRLETTMGAVEAPARITPDVAPNAAAIAFGQGHERFGRLASGRGANAFALLGAGQAGSLFGPASVKKKRNFVALPYASDTKAQHGRNLLRWTWLDETARVDQSGGQAGQAGRVERTGQGEKDEIIPPLPAGFDPGRDLYAPHEHAGRRWAMVIDLHRCIGCGACAVACYAENNIPVRGEREVERGREQAWLKVVPYRLDDVPARLAWLPLPCQHCDAAPCEPVCPVYAAVHNEEGLNAQVYNRCVGTRYCANNCPYKVRRFNWLNSTWEEPLDWQLNPEVTVRGRGVMEKCTFCVQRIRAAEHRARIEDRKIRDGEITPACAQSCPTGAYVFGDLLDPESRVFRLFRDEPRGYQLLGELNTKPAVLYLRRVLRNSASAAKRPGGEGGGRGEGTDGSAETAWRDGRGAGSGRT